MKPVFGSDKRSDVCRWDAVLRARSFGTCLKQSGRAAPRPLQHPISHSRDTKRATLSHLDYS